MIKENKNIISIIIPTFNRAHLISGTLYSFIVQSYGNWEIIVVDDGATDNTSRTLKTFNDKRIKYHKRNSNHKKGPSGCRNYGLSLAKGEYILFFDDDDIAHPDLLQLCLEQFRKNTIDFCRYGREVFHGEFDVEFNRDKNVDSFKIDNNDLEKMITNKLPFNTCAVVWKKSGFDGEKFNEDLFYSDEWEFYQRLLSKEDIKGVSINKVLLYARKHTNSSTQNFLTSNPKYLNSTRKAMKLVIQNLALKNKMTPSLFNFFVRNGLVLKDYSIIDYLLEKTRAGKFQRLKYKIGFLFYPLLKPVFKLKGKFPIC